MITNSLKYVALAAFAVVTGVGSWFLHRQNLALRTRLPDLSSEREQLAAIRGENDRLRAIVAQAGRDQAGVARQITEEIIKLRAQVADLEQRAVARRAEMLAAIARDEEAMANNHDPTKGLVRFERFENRGQATPAAALQTLIWASLHGDDLTLAEVLALSEECRAQAEKLIGGLPPEARTRWTVDRVAALSVNDAVTNMNAVQIMQERTDDAQHATLVLRFPGQPSRPFSFQLAPTGWQLVLPAEAIQATARKITGPN